MSKKKKTELDIPFIGFDSGKEHGWNFDVMIGQYGNPVIGIRIKNMVEQFSADPDLYLQYHSVLNQVVSILGENHIFQKIDLFAKRIYVAEPSKLFLQQKYSEHFDGRIYKTIETLLFFTDIVEHSKKKAIYNFSEKRYKDLRDRCQKIHMLLSQFQLQPQFLSEKEFRHYVNGTFAMDFVQPPVFDNIASNTEFLRIGKQFVKTISYVDAVSYTHLRAHET